MSKQKGKDKKGDNVDHIQAQYELQKRQIYDADFKIRKLQQRLNDSIQQKEALLREKAEDRATFEAKIQELQIKQDTNEKRLLSMRNQLTNSQIENKRLMSTVIQLQRSLSEERQEHSKELEQGDKNFKFEKSKLESMLSDYKLYMAERDQRQKEIHELTEARDMQSAHRIRQIADKQRQKVQATDKIREEMSRKIQQMQKDLRSLKKQQLDTTTRLTMLQNHQLTSELQYQTKQTEKIVFRNEELQAKVTTLQQELTIHKQVEDELAKRSHFSKGIIKKLYAKIAELEEKLQGKNQEFLEQNQKSSQRKLVNQIHGNANEMRMDQSHSKSQENEAVAQSKQLVKLQKEYAKLLARCTLAQKTRDQLIQNSKNGNGITNQLHRLLTKFYTENILDKSPTDTKVVQRKTSSYEGFGLKHSKQNLNFKNSLQKLRETPVSQWPSEAVKTAIELMLTSLQPILTKSTNSLPQFKISQTCLTSEAKYNDSKDKKVQFEQTLLESAPSKEKLSAKLISKLASGKLRSWGKQIIRSRESLTRKYKLNSSYRI